MTGHACAVAPLEVRDLNGENVVRAFHLCPGQWLAVSRDQLLVPNGMIWGDWRGPLGFLLTLAKRNQGFIADRALPMPAGYIYIALKPELSVRELAAILQADPAEVRAELADFVLAEDVA